MKTHLFIIISLCCFSKFSKSQEKKTSINQKLFFEKVYLHTDRDIYSAGENIWFSAYLVNGQDNRLLSTSNTLYTELIANENPDEVQKKIIRLENGTGKGDFQLTETIPHGIYTLRAWTNWMRNFGELFIFEKKIQIVGELTNNTAMLNSSSQKNKPVNTSQTKQVTQVDSLEFLPEGGSLVNDIVSMVAFKSFRSNPNLIQGIIYNSKQEVVTTIEGKNGMGTFMFMPVLGESYTAKGKFSDGETFNQPLPVALPVGYAIRIIEKDSLYQVIINTSKESELIGKDILLAGKSHGMVCFKKQLTITNPQQMISIHKNNFPAGIAAITLYDIEGKPNCERLVYVDQIKPTIIITPLQNFHKTDMQVKGNIRLRNESNSPLKGNFSIAAVDASLAKSATRNIVSYLMLESELGGRVDNPHQYFDLQDPDRMKKLNLLLLTQGWRDFLWKKVAVNSTKLTHIPETGITISGTVKRKLGDKGIPNSNVTLRSTSSKQTQQLISGTTNESGRFFLDGFKFIGEQKFAANAVNKKGDNEGWIKLDPIFKPIAFYPKENSVLDTSYLSSGQEILSRYKNMKRRNALSDTIMLDEITIKTGPVILGNSVLKDLGYKDREYDILPSDTTYQDLRHYLLTNDKQTGLQDNFVVFRVGTRIIYPNFIVNNRHLFFMEHEIVEEGQEEDTEVRDNIYDTYLNLPMSEIKKVTIKHMVGVPAGAIEPRDFFLIYLSLNDGATLGGKKNPIITQTTGYYEAREFSRPITSSKQAPDLSTTLYWNPSVKINENGEADFSFRSPGIKGKIRVQIQGITETGNPLAAESIIDVE
jgi:hypothetical protein